MEGLIVWCQNVANYVRNICLRPIRGFQCQWFIQRLFPYQKTASVPKDDLIIAQQLWNYMLMNQEPKKSDLILVLGNPDLRTAEFSAKLWLDGMSPWIMFSGKHGVLTKGKWPKPEAEIFQDVALSLGVPKDKIILETEATNTGENIKYSYHVLKSRDLLQQLRSIILVQMPLMERRTFATFMKQWPGFTENPDLKITVTSPNIPLLKYPNKDVGTLEKIITLLMGCLYRIKTYPAEGFQIHQEIPNELWDSYLKLYDSGKYNGHLPS